MTVKRVISSRRRDCEGGVFVWNTLFRFITTPGISYSETLSDDLKTVVESLFRAQGYEDAVRQDISSFPGADLQKPILQRVLQFALDKACTEIDLRKDEEGIYSPVASVQTGHQSVANVSQAINPDVSATLREVLDAIGQHIERLDALPGQLEDRDCRNCQRE